MKVVYNQNIASYQIDKNAKQSKKLKQQQENNNCDTVEISSEQKKTVVDDDISYITSLKDFLRKNSENSALSEILKNVSGQNKKKPSLEKIEKICMKIASRIRNGDKVPLKDLKYLLEKDPQLYQMAMLSIKPNDNPKKCEQLSPDEDQDAVISSLNCGVNNSSTETASSITIISSTNETN